MENQKCIISILVKNQPGVLSRISGLFSRRGYNIDGLSVCATEDVTLSRMTITVLGTKAIIKQIISQVEKQVDVVKVEELDVNEIAFRELLLIKVKAGQAERSQIADLCNVFKAKAIDISTENMTLEITGSTQKVDAFIAVLAPYVIIEMARSGGSALKRG